ncbi:MAG: hypothetical protein COX79_04805 [Candidatus Levybacteria bacterium CG_4_10_14_0_2_um_filter_36_16]|nr:MAG: hypothetical protein AUK12_00560 [Candidatus Levybacteria bacterium CG2_30_37_29]PIR79153.1 MAG: hypothetical protein COU26_02680 [Candidatus Levybacteria bacterium CG10_big_fil_rev_8_21_14_0_10_36_30]PIZ96562.1 MAG: hypothetical protein COX79_04805 [Candidatus Levybacteria bacterium CG_4_10_14_0_2_um_filter_36_16]
MTVGKNLSKNIFNKRIMGIESFIKKLPLVLISIVLLASLLRLYNIGVNPPGVHADEADTGYSAYSILKTGLTQYGEFNLLALGEFNGGTHPPLYTYILIPLISLFGLNIVIERMPAVIFGILTIPIFYYLIKRLSFSEPVARLGALLMALNPWHIFISRQGLLESIAVFFVSLGVLLFLMGKEKKNMYILSAVSLGLSLHSYDAPKIFVLPFVFLLTIYQWESLVKAKKHFILFIVILALFYGLTLKVLFLDKQINDFNRINSFNIGTISKTVNDERQMTQGPLWMSSIFHNKITVMSKQYISNYFNIFSISWFFVDGHGDLLEWMGRHGQFYMFELPFFFIGLYLAFKKKKIGMLLVAWILIAHIPGAITTGKFYPYRSVLILPIPIIFSSIGIVWFWKWLSKAPPFTFILRTAFLCVCVGIILSLMFTYFYDYPVYASEWRFKERNQALNFASSIQNKYDRVFVNGGTEWAVMYSFNDKILPSTFQKAYLNKGEYKDVKTIDVGKFSFGSFDVQKVATPSSYFSKNSLVVIDSGIFPNHPSLKTFSGADPLKIIYKVIEVK